MQPLKRRKTCLTPTRGPSPWIEENSSINEAEGVLLIIAGTGSVRLPDRHLDDSDVVSVELAGKLTVKVPCNIFGRWRLLSKWREFVEILVIQLLEKGVGLLLEDLEVDTESGLVQFASSYGDLDLPVVTVQVLAVSLIMCEAVGGSKRGVNR